MSTVVFSDMGASKVQDNGRLVKRPAINASDPPISRAIAYGINAPNPHNTQAWKIKHISDLETLVYLDEHRLLPMTDPPPDRYTSDVDALSKRWL